jgi:hypothetical protein
MINRGEQGGLQEDLVEGRLTTTKRTKGPCRAPSQAGGTTSQDDATARRWGCVFAPPPPSPPCPNPRQKHSPGSQDRQRVAVRATTSTHLHLEPRARRAPRAVIVVMVVVMVVGRSATIPEDRQRGCGVVGHDRYPAASR